MTAEYPSETNSDLGREQGVPESTRTIQDGSHPVEAIGARESEVIGWAASYGMGQRVGLGMDSKFINPLHQGPDSGSEVFFVPTQATQTMMHNLVDNFWECFWVADTLICIFQDI